MALSFVSKLDQQSGTSVAFDATGANFLHVSIMRRSGTTMSITFNGVAMTQIGINTGHSVAGSDDLFSFGLIAPTSGSHTIAITTDGSLVRWTAASYAGANQSVAWEAVTTHSSASSAPQSVSVTPTKSGWILGGIWCSDNIVADANTTLRSTTNSSGVIDSNANKISTYAIGYSNSNPGDLIGFNLIDAVQPASSNLLMFF